MAAAANININKRNRGVNWNDKGTLAILKIWRDTESISWIKKALGGAMTRGIPHTVGGADTC